MQATMVEEEQREFFIAIDESTAHGTYNNDRSFGLALSVQV